MIATANEIVNLVSEIQFDQFHVLLLLNRAESTFTRGWTMNPRLPGPIVPKSDALTPEEDTLGDPEEAEEEVDDFLPADLWY